MALFNRGNKNKTGVPAEIQEYYQAEKRDRTGIAWLLAFATLVVTILLAAGIFFAGRWAYRKIAGNDGQNNAPQTAQNENQQEEQQAQEPSEDTDQSEEEKRAEEERQRAEQEAKEAEERRAEEERKAKEAQEQKAREEAERREAAQTPSELPSGTGTAGENDRQVASNGGDIPETGPGDTVAIFIAVTFLGYIAHRVHFAQKTK